MQVLERSGQMDEYYNPGFMTGLAGIGYGLIRQMNETLPFVLMGAIECRDKITSKKGRWQTILYNSTLV